MSRGGVDADGMVRMQIPSELKIVYEELYKTKAERDALREKNDDLRSSLVHVASYVQEIETEKKRQEENFRKALKTEKQAFEKKFMKQAAQLSYRDGLLTDWIRTTKRNTGSSSSSSSSSSRDEGGEDYQELMLKSMAMMKNKIIPKLSDTHMHTQRNASESDNEGRMDGRMDSAKYKPKRREHETATITTRVVKQPDRTKEISKKDNDKAQGSLDEDVDIITDDDKDVPVQIGRAHV
jgi:hypothetical protein